MVPEGIVQQLTALGFTATAWGEDGLAAIRGHGQEYIGTEGEVRAYLVAWSACQALLGAKQLSPLISWTIVAMTAPFDILPRQLAVITVRPYFSFRGYRIAVPDDIAPLFTIDDVRIGNRSQFVQTQSLAADAFACRIDEGPLFRAVESGKDMFTIEIVEAAVAEFGRAFDMATTQVAEELVIYATNVSDQPSPFTAFVLGRRAVAP